MKQLPEQIADKMHSRAGEIGSLYGSHHLKSADRRGKKEGARLRTCSFSWFSGKRNGNQAAAAEKKYQQLFLQTRFTGLTTLMGGRVSP